MTRRNTSPGKAKVYLEKSRRFATAARWALEAEQWDPAASAAVHAAINAADAANIHYLGEHSRSHAHRDTVAMVQEIEGPGSDEVQRLAKHLERLLSMKNLAEYEDKLLGKRDAVQAVTAMERARDIVERWAQEWG